MSCFPDTSDYNTSRDVDSCLIGKWDGDVSILLLCFVLIEVVESVFVFWWWTWDLYVDWRMMGKRGGEVKG